MQLGLVLGGKNEERERRVHEIIDFSFASLMWILAFVQIKKKRERENSDLSRDKLVAAVLCTMNARRLLMCAFVC